MMTAYAIALASARVSACTSGALGLLGSVFNQVFRRKNLVIIVSTTYRFNIEILSKLLVWKDQFLLCYSMNYRDFSVKSKLIISLFETVKLSLSISLFEK